MHSFNVIRGKEFVEFDKFDSLCEANKSEVKDVFASNSKTKLILISGVPGSGKSSLGQTITRLFNTESHKAHCMNMDVI